jgi:hypothetical protein
MPNFAEKSIAEDFRRAAEKRRRIAEMASSEVAAKMLLVAKSYDNLAEMLERSIRPPR